MIPRNKLLFPVVGWAAIQLILLGIGASGLPLWAHQPAPPESLTLPILMCGQILVSSMLLPVLAGSAWAVAINLAMMLPFDELAGMLSNTSQASIAKSLTCVGLWILGLSLWRKHRIVSTAAIVFTAGGAMLDYLRWEQFFADGGQSKFHPVSLLANICLEHWFICWIEAAIPLAAGGTVLLFTTWWRKRILHFTPLSPNKPKNTATSCP